MNKILNNYIDKLNKKYKIIYKRNNLWIIFQNNKSSVILYRK